MSIKKDDYLMTDGFGRDLLFRIVSIWKVAPGIMACEVIRVKPSKDIHGHWEVVSFGRTKNLPMKEHETFAPAGYTRITEKEILNRGY